MSLRSFGLIAIFAMITNGVQIPGTPARSPFCHNIDGNWTPCPEDLKVKCEVKHIKYEHDCSTFDFSTPLFGGQLQQDESLSFTDVNIRAYTYQERNKAVPNVNVTFSNIKFTSLIYRMKIVCAEDHRMQCWKVNVLKSNVSNVVVPSALLFWDCKWFDSSFSNCGITLEYRAFNGKSEEFSKVLLKLPQKRDTQSHDYEILVYIQYHVQCVTIHWTASHDKISTYRVKLYEIGNNIEEKPVVVVINGTTHKFCHELKPFTVYNVSVEGQVSDNVWSQPSFSVSFPTISSTTNNLGTMVTIFVLCVFLLIFLSASLIKYYRSRNTPMPNSCIIFYHPTSRKHVEVVGALVNFLRRVIHVRYFETDVNAYENPEDWWGRELPDADLILVVSNPNQRDMIPGSIFAPLFRHGFVENFLRSWMVYRSPQKRAIRILLPYCEENNGFYDFLNGTPCYNILRDRFKLLQEILGPPNLYLPGCLASRHFSCHFKSNQWTVFKEALKNYNIETQLNDNNQLANPPSLVSVSSVEDDSSDGDDDVVDRCQRILSLQNGDSSEAESESEANVTSPEK